MTYLNSNYYAGNSIKLCPKQFSRNFPTACSFSQKIRKSIIFLLKSRWLSTLIYQTVFLNINKNLQRTNVCASQENGDKIKRKCEITF